MNKCDQCGICCQLFLINLTEDEYESGQYQTINQEFGQIDDFALAEAAGANFLAQNADGSCIYLTENGCGIHQTRPQVCRDFFCTSTDPKFKDMIDQIQTRKLSILEK